MIQWSHKRKARHQRGAGNAFQNVAIRCDTMESQKQNNKNEKEKHHEKENYRM